MGSTRVPNAHRSVPQETYDDAASKFKAVKKLGPKAYASNQIIEAVEDGKSIDEVLDLAVDLAPDKIKRIKEKVKRSMNPSGARDISLRRKAGINPGNKLCTRQVTLRLQIEIIIKQTSPLDRLSKHTSAQEQTGRSTELSSELKHATLAASKQVMQR